MSDFFDYHCEQCGKPFCERIQVMNLALNHLESGFCLECLSSKEELDPIAFYQWILDYIELRPCFKTPWTEFDYSPCPRVTDKSCFCEAS
jgi:hypothetical protein